MTRAGGEAVLAVVLRNLRLASTERQTFRCMSSLCGTARLPNIMAPSVVSATGPQPQLQNSRFADPQRHSHQHMCADANRPLHPPHTPTQLPQPRNPPTASPSSTAPTFLSSNTYHPISQQTTTFTARPITTCATLAHEATTIGGPSADPAPGGRTTTATATGASVDRREAAKFAALADSWWHSEDGAFAPLHALNPARGRFVRHSLAAALGLDAGAPESLTGLRVLDVGCGGGILSEALARLGAQVHGIDVTRENVEAARLHARRDPRIAARVRYDVISAEELAASCTAPYDVVVASEVLEHVSRPHQLLHVLASLVRPAAGGSGNGGGGCGGVEGGAPPGSDDDASDERGGTAAGDVGVVSGGGLIISTLNRTPASWAVAIAGAEYVARVVPAGTHHWHKFITPEELAIMAGACGLQVWHAAGMAPVGPRMTWELTEDLSVNYIALLRPRPGIPPPPQQ